MVKTEKIDYLNLKANLDFPFITRKFSIKAGEYKGGEVLQLGADGVLEPLVAGGNPHSVLTQPYSSVDNFKGIVYLTGSLDATKLIMPQDEDIKTYEEKFRNKSIFLVY